MFSDCNITLTNMTINYSFIHLMAAVLILNEKYVGANERMQV